MKTMDRGNCYKCQAQCDNNYLRVLSDNHEQVYNICWSKVKSNPDLVPRVTCLLNRF